LPIAANDFIFQKGAPIMKIGIISTSTKKNEKRYPLHASHIKELSKHELEQLVFENDYPGLEDLKQSNLLTTMNREHIFEACDVIILAKPTPKDFVHFRENQILWGWPHCVQSKAITDIGIKKNMTFIAWEAMFKWKNNVRQEHIFSRNNELAGYASVIHALTHLGMTGGVYGQERKVAVIGYGSTGKGAINALRGLGAHDISVYSRRTRFEVADALGFVTYKNYRIVKGVVIMNGKRAADELSQYDIIVNCVLQNPLKPIMFLTYDDVIKNGKKQLIIDVSCDKGMSFEFAKPTGFDQPTFEVGPSIYYAVNHSPTYFWESASYELSGAILPYLRYFLKHGTYIGDNVLEHAVEIEAGRIVNPDIIAFQNRESHYPYHVKK
jgi:alanine dehydrogenase